MISKKKRRSSRQVMLHRAKFGRGGHVHRGGSGVSLPPGGIMGMLPAMVASLFRPQKKG
jgi:hypothetical protein